MPLLVPVADDSGMNQAPVNQQEAPMSIGMSERSAQ